MTDQRSKRGVVVAPRITPLPGGGVMASSGLDPTELRRYATYWDVIDVPTNNIVHVGLGADADSLQAAGLLMRTRVELPGGFVGPAVPFVPFQVLNLHHRQQPGMWTLGQNAPALEAPADLVELTRTLELELYEILPVPDASVPIDELLKFRERRADELHALRAHIDRVYQEVLGAADIPRAKTSAIDQLERAVVDVNRVFNESRMQRLRSSMKVEISLGDVLDIAAKAAAGTAAAFAMHIAVPAAIATVGATVAPMIKINWRDVLRPRKLPEGLRDYAYLGYLAKDVGVQPAPGENAVGTGKKVEHDAVKKGKRDGGPSGFPGGRHKGGRHKRR